MRLLTRHERRSIQLLCLVALLNFSCAQLAEPEGEPRPAPELPAVPESEPEPQPEAESRPEPEAEPKPEPKPEPSSLPEQQPSWAQYKDNGHLYQLTDVELQCPDGYELYETGCYKVYSIARSWPQAIAVCSRYGSQLAKISNSRDNEFVGRLAKSSLRTNEYSHMWLGLVTQQTQDVQPVLIWSDGSVVSRYAGFWDQAQPDFDAGACATMALARTTSTEANYPWQLSVCNLLLPFACQLPACVRGSFFCANGGCVSGRARCDGIDDCGDYSDEFNCHAARGNGACLKYERGESGTFQSPNYPSSYPAQADCQWVVEGPINSRIQLKFDFFETEEHSDMVQLLDGGPAANTSAVIATLSGALDKSELTFTSSTNMLNVKFRSDAELQTRGFQATWRSVSLECGGDLKAQKYAQTFSSPGYPNAYPNGLECVWRIEAPRGQLITLDVKDMMLEPKRDFLVIYDGSSPSDPILLRFSGIFDGSQLVISSQRYVYIYFFTNYAVGGRGFQMSYKAGCDNVIRENKGVLLSPGHMSVSYPTSQQCSYTLDTPDSANPQPLTLAVNTFQVLQDDALQIFDGDSPSGKPLHPGNGFSGKDRPPSTFVSEEGRFHLVFSSNPIRSSKGWNITFSTNCPPLDLPTGVSLSTLDTRFGTQVTVACPRGHEFVTGQGQQYQVHCLIGGIWSDTRVPPCQPMYCSPVPQINNGFAISSSNVTYGGSAKYQCYQGFRFPNGRETEEIFCTDEGRWTPTPMCKAQTCPALPPFDNGKKTLVFGDGTGYGTVYRYECDAGYYRFGVPALLCQTSGTWSTPQPECTKLPCFDLPEVENGIIVDASLQYKFGDATRVMCRPGYRAIGDETIRCLANQTFSQAPTCVDINECQDGSAACLPGSTQCINLPGGYKCQCLPGYESQMSCTIANPLGLSTGVIDGSLLESSSQVEMFELPKLGATGWCGKDAGKNGENWVSIELVDPTVIERIRFEKVGADRSAYTTKFTLRYAKDAGMPSKPYLDADDQQLMMTANVDNGLPAELVVLPEPIEARVLFIQVRDYVGAPCMKVELFGCRKSNCIDKNECALNNGACEQVCVNTPGSYQCSCRQGYDLFVEDGQGGFQVPEAESGSKDNDVLRFNKSCIPRHCPTLTKPENGILLSTSTTAQHHPMVIEFQCNFGYQMVGPSHLQCLADGSWNGTAPTCIPAYCEGLQNNTAIGLFITPENNTVAYGQNVSILCTQKNRPQKSSGFPTFRQCVYDPQPDGRQYWLAGALPDCPLVDCGAPSILAGANYDGLNLDDPNAFKVGSQFGFSCRAPYLLAGNSSVGDQTVRCLVDSRWDFGNLRCEGPVCVDPGYPPDAEVALDSVEEGAVAKYNCRRQGYSPKPSPSIACKLGSPCVLSEDVGISSGFIPDGAFADNADSSNPGYEPFKARISSTGWCGNKDAFIFLSVDLQRVYTLTQLRLAGVAGAGHLRGHVTKMQLFYKVQFSQNYDTYPVEFNSPPGNHNEMHIFELKPPLRARYILLGVTEYDTNPCIRFDLSGCLAPLSLSQEVPLHLQVGWNSTVPECVDTQKPTFTNCPAGPIFISNDEHGQLIPAEYEEPQAIDNSGKIAWIRIEPEGFKPPKFITTDTDVMYTVFDEAGNSAQCKIELRIPDTYPPVITCPESYAVELTEQQPSVTMYFNETSVNVIVQDISNITNMAFEPTMVELGFGKNVDVTVRATDQLGNQNTCKFQVAVLAAACQPWDLPVPANTIKTCTANGQGGQTCSISCADGFQFVDGERLTTQFTCQPGQPWQPAPSVPTCVPIAIEPARYELTVTTTYPVATQVGAECLRGYTEIVSSYFDQFDQVLSQRCSSSVQMFVRMLNTEFVANSNDVTANYTLQILPTVLQDVFYQLCGLTLRTIFDVNIPGATAPIAPVLTIPGEAIATQGVGCPTLKAQVTTVSEGFGCADGEVLRQAPDKKLPECLPCPIGSVLVNNTCMMCPVGTYQDEAGMVQCKACPQNTFTLHAGSIGMQQCLAVCGSGSYSDTGMIPCQQCPRHTFSGPPILGGYRACEPCPADTFTANIGSTGPSACKHPCDPGTFSITGLKPCSDCPINFFQPSTGQQRCIECPTDTFTSSTGTGPAEGCQAVDCDTVNCLNGGVCEVKEHVIQCQCPPGFSGPLCEKNQDECLSQPCFNNAQCVDQPGSFKCICPQNFTGMRCEFGPDECIGLQCPNGGVCQDLPGLGTTKCLCRTGYTGPTCSQIVNPCKTDNPCKNGADCQAHELGRYKCVCLPGWTGATCETNIDDCADKPCALNATCTDGVNDFVCECPPGFTGKRCHIKQNLCDQDPCIHGMCADRLYSQQCVCDPGWTGKFCEINIDECASDPCKNGATCRDDIDAFMCQCPIGYYGSLCQHPVDHCGSDPCRNNATCTNHGATYRCECRLGYEGTHCEHNTNECETLKRCASGTQTCVDLVNAFRCQCRPGFTGEFCEIEINECASGPCLNNGTCVDGIAEYSCLCAAGWEGKRCEIEKGGCEREPCQNDGKCVNLVGDYFCVCPSGVDGKNCEIAPNRCIGEPCHNGGVCGDYGSRMECTCPKDYVGDGCQYELDACKAGICQNGADCEDYEAGYKCTCLPGFTGVNCETNIDDCSPSPCPLSATCIDQVNSHYCLCPFNMTGANCDKKISTDYDLHFYDPILPAQAGLSVPFAFQAKALTIAMWVRFEMQGSRGTVFTLYSSQAVNYPDQVAELVRLSSEGMRVQLFEDEAPLVLQLPASQPINDGNWNHIAFVWSSSDGSYSLIWNAVRIYADSGYGIGKQLEFNAWITLGYPFSDTPNEPKFVGSITRVNMWKRALSFQVEIPSLVESCQGANVIHDGLALRWTGYDRLSGKVEPVVRSWCGPNSCDGAVDANKNNCQLMNRQDKRTPEAKYCPGDLYVVTGYKEVNVTWQPAVFDDDRGLARVEHNLSPGQVFTWGDYMVLYAAFDNSSNMAQCSFKIHVSRDFCPELKDPVNGIQQCDSWGPNLQFRACSIHCENGYEFSTEKPPFYTCGSDGLWRPRPRGTHLFKYPQCSKMSSSTRVMKLSLDYPTRVICNSAGSRTLREKLIAKIAELNKKWNICATSSDDGGCTDLQVEVECSGDGNSRAKRQTQQDTFYQARIEFPANRDPVVATDAEENGGDNEQSISTVIEVLQDAVLLNDDFNFENVLPNGKPDLNSLDIDDSLSCPLGRVPVDNACVACAPGSMFDEDTAECQMCPIGTYQSEAGQTSCMPCPSGMTTTGPGSSASNAGDCKESCERGQYFNLNSSQCEDCGYGFYQPSAGSFLCQPCGVGKTTLTTRSDSVEMCKDECPDGQHLMGSAGICEKCASGSYRTRGIHKTCTPCPTGMTTEAAGSSKPSQCDIPRCESGQYLLLAEKRCVACPRGTYQEEPLQQECTKCSHPDHTTPPLPAGATHGATNPQQCYSTNQCDTGENNCSWNAVCIDQPDENDLPRFKCECKPGYRGNGTHCEDACIEFCLNDGVCKKNPVGYVSCECKEQFTGDRCELRYQPKTQKIAYIAGGIGGVVAILIMIVIIIWMICFRFNTRPTESANEKAAHAADLSDRAVSRQDDNFAYARPGFQAPPALTAPGATANGGGGMRSIGYYYEDDDDYDMKTMYINDGYNDMAVEQPAGSAVDSQGKDEMFERLRRINEHMYRPKGDSDAGSDTAADDMRTSH